MRKENSMQSKRWHVVILKDSRHAVIVEPRNCRNTTVYELLLKNHIKIWSEFAMDNRMIKV